MGLFDQPAMRMLSLLAIFLVTVMAIYFVVDGVSRRGQVRRQLDRMTGDRSIELGEVGTSGLVRDSKGSALGRVIAIIERSGLSLTDSAPDALRMKMVAAGYDSPDAPRIYSLIRLLLIVLLPVILIVGLIASGSELTFLNLYVFGSVCAILGLILPSWILRIITDRRKEAIVNGFPNCLDLMLVCVEAGLGMEAALDRVGRELAEADPILSKLIVRTNLHLRAGASREQALRRLAETSGVSEIRSFCTLLIQSEKLGTSIGMTLRVFAGEMRERRKMRAEEKAHRLPVLISIPLVACMLPTMVGVLMLPAAVRVVRELLPAMMGG